MTKCTEDRPYMFEFEPDMIIKKKGELGYSFLSFMDLLAKYDQENNVFSIATNSYSPDPDDLNEVDSLNVILLVLLDFKTYKKTYVPLAYRHINYDELTAEQLRGCQMQTLEIITDLNSSLKTYYKDLWFRQKNVSGMTVM